MPPSSSSAANAASAKAGLNDRLLAMRDRLLASAGFRRWATRFPLTRPIARRRARALFDLCAGFVYTQVLLACTELRLFDLLAEGPRSLSFIAARTDLGEAAALRLLNAAVSLRLLGARGVDASGARRFGLGPLGAAAVDNPGVQAMVEHHRLLYADLRDPVALLRGQTGDTALAGYWPYAGARSSPEIDAGAVGAYTALMAASQPLVAEEVLAAYDLRRHRVLLDIGGGDGSFLQAAARRAPHLKLMLFDLPEVAKHASRRFAAAGLAHAAVAGGDFRTDPLPAGADVASLVRVVHDHDDAAALRILRAAWQALPAGGTLLVAEPMAGCAGAEPMADAYFGFYLLAMGSGRARTEAEILTLLGAAGFEQARRAPTSTPLLTSLVVARRGMDKA